VVRDAQADRCTSLLKAPETLPGFVKLADGSGFVAVEDVIRANLSQVYLGPIRGGGYAFASRAAPTSSSTASCGELAAGD